MSRDEVRKAVLVYVERRGARRAALAILGAVLVALCGKYAGAIVGAIMRFLG